MFVIKKFGCRAEKEADTLYPRADVYDEELKSWYFVVGGIK